MASRRLFGHQGADSVCGAEQLTGGLQSGDFLEAGRAGRRPRSGRLPDGEGYCCESATVCGIAIDASTRET